MYYFAYQCVKRAETVFLTTLCFILTMLLSGDVAYSYSETMQRFLSTKWVVPETKDAVSLLKKTVTETESKLPADLQNVLRTSLAEKLSRLSAEIDRYSDERYKSSYAGIRILELIDKVSEIQYRKIDRNIEKRRQASQQYAELLSALQESLKKENTAYSTNVSIDMLDKFFTNIQNNILESGYGNPLNQEEFRELKQILDKTVSQLLPLVKETDDTQQQIENRQKAIRIVMEGVRNCSEFLQKRDFIDSFVSSREVQIALYMKNETLRKKLNIVLTASGQDEFKLHIERSKAEEKKMIEENAPETIRKKREAEENADKEQYIKVNENKIIFPIRLAFCLVGLIMILIALYLNWKKR
jgi:hypothetical protein